MNRHYSYTLLDSGTKALRDTSQPTQTRTTFLRSLVFLAIASLLYLILGSASARPLLAILHIRSSQTAGTLRVAIYDSFWEHYEVIGPLIYHLSQIPNLDLTVYRTYFTDGYPELLASYYPGPFHRAEEFFVASPNATTAHNVDVLFLPNADREIRKMLEEGSTLEQYPNLRRAKIVAGVHRTDQWLPLKEKPDGSALDWMNTPAGQLSMKASWLDGRLSFFTLSSHVKRSLRSGLLGSAFEQGPRIETFIPVIPNISGALKNASAGPCMHAAIQGTFNGDRDYDRIFTELEAEIRANPSEWGYELVKNEEGQDHLSAKRDEQGGENPFKLHLLGHLKHWDTVSTGSSLLQNVVRVHKNLPYKEYYSKLSEMDVLIPAWKSDSQYFDSRASSSIPAAIMSRIPTLLSSSELAAYDYARGPAILERREDNNEMQAIGRLRREGKCGPAGGTAWEKYERTIARHNRAVLKRTLYS